MQFKTDHAVHSWDYPPESTCLRIFIVLGCTETAEFLITKRAWSKQNISGKRKISKIRIRWLVRKAFIKIYVTIKIFWSSQLSRIARLVVIFQTPSFSQKAVVPRGITYTNFAVFAFSIRAEIVISFCLDGGRENSKIRVLNFTGNYSFLWKEGV